MSDADPLLTIIMPCFNGSKTISRAIDSILNQKTNYPYEILVIDDGSTDNSLEIVRDYASVNSNIRVLQNETNRGNAKTFYKGLKNTLSKYYAVLDVDDYYTVDYKIQKQLEFLENDFNEYYVGVTHEYLIDLGNGNISIPSFSGMSEYTYIDFINQRCGYHHTATYIYRNIFHGEPPELFLENRFRGDTVRTAIMLMYSNKKIYDLKFVGSAYYWSEEGIWSSLDQKKQFDIQIRIWSGLKELSTTDYEQRCYEKLINQCIEKQKKAECKKRQYLPVSIDEAICKLNDEGRRYAFCQNEEYVFKGLYNSLLLDSCANSLGTIYYQNAILDMKSIDTSTVAMIVCTLNPTGGGLFRENEEIIEMYSDKKFVLISTGEPPDKDEVKQILSKYPNLTYITYPGNVNKFEWLVETYYKYSPYRTYYYDSHCDYYPYALMDSRCENICLFSYDHGFVSGLSTPKITKIIAKRPLDYKMLKERYGEKIIYIPAWNDPRHDLIEYTPFREHSKIITACGAARFYKIKSSGQTSYLHMVANLLKITGGKHIHFGPIPDELKYDLYDYMDSIGVERDSFIHVAWAEDPPALLIKNNVDLFIEPFPIVSYKISMDMYMCGIPVLSYCGFNRMSKMDFIYEGNLVWHNEDEFYSIIEKLDAEELKIHSEKSKIYFQTTHNKEIIKSYFVNLKQYEPIRDIDCTDNRIRDVTDFPILFNHETHNTNQTVVCHKNNNHIPVLSFVIQKLISLESIIINKGTKFDCNSKIIQDMIKVDPKRAYRFCIKNKETSVAQGWIGRMYQDGIGVKVNKRKAIHWYKLSIANNGPLWANTRIAELLFEQNPQSTEAFEYLLVAAKQNDISAIIDIARAYRDGLGTPSNLDEAIHWMKLACTEKTSWVLPEYVMLLITRGNEDDITEAIKLCEKGCVEKDPKLMLILSSMYADGIYVKKDEEKASLIEKEALALKRN